MALEGGPDPLQEFFATCPEMLFILGGDSAIRRLSAPLQQMLGAEVGEGSRLAAHLHPDDLGAFEAGWAALGERDEGVTIECRLRGADGVYRPWSLRARRSKKSGEIHGALRESEAQRGEEAARIEMEAHLLRTFMDNLNMVVCATDERSNFIYQNGHGLERVGLAPGALLGQNIFEVYGDLISEEVHTVLEGKVAHVLSEAHQIPWENWYVPRRDEQGAITGMAIFTLDLTDVRKAEQDLRAQLALVERQQRVIRALSTPIIEVWDKVLTLPMLGVVDSARAADVMDNLLGQVSRKGARFAIIDLTGVETVDTSTASHLVKMIQALRLLGAEGIITGIQPEVAQTMVALGMELGNIVTLANLRDGLRLCIKRMRESKT